MATTAPLYWIDERGRPHFEGSGVLVSLAGQRLLVSATHVLQRRLSSPMAAGVANALIAVPAAGLNVVTTGRDLDVTVIPLANDDWARVPPSEFLTEREIDLSAPRDRGHAIALVGYPHSKQQDVPVGSRLDVHAYQLVLLERPAATYAALHYDRAVQLAVGLRKRLTWGPGGLRTAPNLQGVSGCGLWKFAGRLRDATEPPLLTAVVTEWHSKGLDAHLLGTRMSAVLWALGDTFPALREMFV
jgi:hypothetical protein